MMSSYAASIGLLPTDPAFWVPMLLLFLTGIMVLGTIVFDGFDMGVGLLLPFAPVQYRQALMTSLSPWRSVNETWVLLTFALAVAAFPFAFSTILNHLYLPMLLCTVGVVTRSIAFEFRARSAPPMRSFWLIMYGVGAFLSAFGLGLILAAFATGYQQDATNLVFILFVTVCAMAACVLMGSCLLIIQWQGEVRQLAARWGIHAVRWVAAGMTAVSIMLAMANPAILYKWTHIDNLIPAGMLWTLMLACFVWVEIYFKGIRAQRIQGRLWLPFVLCVILLGLMLLGMVYSLFPFLVLDEVTLWDAVPSASSMSVILAAILIVMPVIVLRHLSNYRLIFSPSGVRL
jgi:cytochrome bd ubiquinol oxidase subunit II